MHSLSSLGFSDFFLAHLPEGAVAARVAAEHRGVYDLWLGLDGQHLQIVHGRLAGRLRHETPEAWPGVGDWVWLRTPADTEGTIIEGVLPRRTVFLRGAAGRETRAQVIAANVDTVFVVTGLDGDYNLHRIERYISLIWTSGAIPAVILNKTDLRPDWERVKTEVEDRCPAIRVHGTQAVEGRGLEVVEAAIGPRQTAAFVGSSGAGKSTLLNAFLGEQRIATAPTRARDDRGRHTTTHRQLFLLPGGGFVLDTPGMRELALVHGEGLEAIFGDIGALAGSCRYRDCRHEGEPGCAVVAAIERGDLDPDRLEHYKKLKDEADSWERRQDVRSRREDDRRWGRFLADAKKHSPHRLPWNRRTT